jgi:hypothetical protein
VGPRWESMSVIWSVSLSSCFWLSMSEMALPCSWMGCSGSLGSSMKVDGEWPRLAADPVWWTIKNSKLLEVWSPFGS